MKQTEIALPPTWRELADKRMLVEEGDYLVEVERVEHGDDNRIKALLRVISGGPELNRVLHETFSLADYPEKFYELLRAVGIDAQARSVQPDDLIGARIGVTVKHRKDDKGRFWANVVQYRCDPGWKDEPRGETSESHPRVHSLNGPKDYLTLAEAAKLVPGRRTPHVSCLWRWARRGLLSRTGERIHLKHRRVGRRLYTSKAALDEFFARISEADLEHFNKSEHKLETIPVPKNESQRKRAIRDAERRLEAEGF